MSELFYNVLAVLTLPIGTLLVVQYVMWSADRDLDRSQRKRIDEAAQSRG